MDKIIYKGLGHKLAFRKWSLITHSKKGNVKIMPVSKQVYNVLKALGYPEEC